MITDAFSDVPLLTTVQVNEWGIHWIPRRVAVTTGVAALETSMTLQSTSMEGSGSGMPTMSEEVGIFGTMAVGPTLRDEALDPMPLGGQDTL